MVAWTRVEFVVHVWHGILWSKRSNVSSDEVVTSGPTGQKYLFTRQLIDCS